MKRKLFFSLVVLAVIFSSSSSAFALSDEEHKMIDSVVRSSEGVERVILNGEYIEIAIGCSAYETSPDKIQQKNAYSMALIRAKDNMAKELYGSSITTVSADSTVSFTTKTNGKNAFRSVITYNVRDDVEEQIIYVTIIALSPLKLLEELKRNANNVLNYLSSGDKYIVVDAESESNTFASALGGVYEYAIWFVLKDIEGLPVETFFEKALFLHALSNRVFTNVTDLDFSTTTTETRKETYTPEDFSEFETKTEIKARVWIDREKFKESVFYALNPKFYSPFTSEFDSIEDMNEDSATFISSYHESGVLKNLFQIEHSDKNVLNQK